jgi:hypothetical protein
MKLEFCWQMLKNPQVSNLMKICWVEDELFHVDWLTDGRPDNQTHMAKLIVAFRSSAIAREVRLLNVPGFVSDGRRMRALIGISRLDSNRSSPVEAVQMHYASEGNWTVGFVTDNKHDPGFAQTVWWLGYQLECWVIGVGFPTVVRGFKPFRNVQSCCRSHQAFYSMGSSYCSTEIKQPGTAGDHTSVCWGYECVELRLQSSHMSSLRDA